MNFKKFVNLCKKDFVFFLVLLKIIFLYFLKYESLNNLIIFSKRFVFCDNLIKREFIISMVVKQKIDVIESKILNHMKIKTNPEQLLPMTLSGS